MMFAAASLALLLAVGCAAPTDAGACKTGCPTSHAANAAAHIRYKPGHVYTYDLHSTVAVQLAGADAQDTKLTVAGRAEIASEADGCTHTLRLDSIVISGPDGKRNTQLGELQLDKAVRFTLANDRLQPELCTDAKDTAFGLNIKRAIISLVQSTRDADETDVFGTCPQTVSVSSGADGALTVSKQRSLNACASRESLHSALLDSVRTGDPANRVLHANSPLLNGDYALEQSIKAGVLERAQLTEEYAYVPHSIGQAGLRARVTTKLQLKKTVAGKIEAACSVPKTILFDSPTEKPMKKVPEGALKTALADTVDAFTDKDAKDGKTGGVRPAAAGKFSELVHLLRIVSKEELLLFNKQIGAGTVHTRKETAKAVFLDALFRAATSESVEAVASLLGTKLALDKRERRMAFLGLHLVQTVERDALLAIAKLLDTNPPAEAYLAVGHLIHRYCHTHPADCHADHVRDIQAKFTSKVGPNCKPLPAGNRHAENIAIAALKGLRNTQHIIVADPVIACTGAQQTTRVRVAALKALQTAAASNPKTTHAALAILENRELDAELRIEAYLVLVAHPCADAANAIKTLLDEETSLQVGSFITTHLAALRSSVDPHRAAARGHFLNVRSTRKFPGDVRQYSFAHECSYAVDSLGAGASADTRVIYSARSFLPRSVNLNVTAQLFGNSLNVLEVDVRQESFDQLLERNFGAKGVFNRFTAQQVFDYLAKVEAKPEGAGDKKPTKHRGRRSVRNDVETLLGKTPVDAESGIGDTELDLSVRLFGTELFFLSLNEQVPLEPKDVLQRLYGAVRSLVRGARNFDEVFEVRTLLLDAELVYPTGVGFPLRLIAHGAGAGRLQVSGQVDLETISKKPSELKFTFKAVPSFDVEISGVLKVDGWVVSTGMELQVQAHSSTGAEVDFKAVSGGFETAVRLPFKKQEVFSFEHKVVTTTQERGQPSFTTPMKFTSKPSEFSGCFDQLHRFVGLTVCGTLSGVTPGSSTPGAAAHPLNGPLHASLSLEVEREYTLKARYEQSPVNQLTIAFDTPGSSDARSTQLVLAATAAGAKKYVSAKLDAPRFTASAEAGLVNDEEATYAYGKYNVQDSQKFLIKLGASKKREGKTVTYTPIARLEAPGKNGEDKLYGWHVTGTVTVTESADGGQVKFNQLQLHSPDAGDEPLQLAGSVGAKGNSFNCDLRVSQGKREGSLKGELRPEAKNFKLDATLLNNVLECANGRLAVEAVRIDGEIRHDLVIVAGKDLANQNRRFEAHQLINFHKSDNVDRAKNFVKSETTVSAPFVPVALKLKFEAKPKLVAYEASATIRQHTIASELEAKLNEKTPGDYDVEAKVSLNKHSVQLEAKRTINAGRSKCENSLEFDNGAKAELDVEFDHAASGQNTDIKIDGSVRLAKADEPHKLHFDVKVTPAKVSSAASVSGPKYGKAIEYSLNVDRNAAAATSTGSWSAVVKDVLTADGNFKSTKHKGDGTSTVHLPGLGGRTLKVDTTFNVAAPAYDVKTDFYYDFDKDPAKKVSVNTRNQITAKQVTSSTDVQVGGETYSVALENAREGAPLPYGQQSGKVTVTLPTKRSLCAEYKRDVVRKGDIVNGEGSFKLTDTLPDKKQRSLTYAAKLADVNPKLRLFVVKQQVDYVGLEGETASATGEYKHQPAGHYKTAGAKLTASGSLIPYPVLYEVVIDEYCPNHAVFHVDIAYGTKATGKVHGNYHVGSRGAEGVPAKPWTYEVQADIALPEVAPMPAQKLHVAAGGRVQLPGIGTDVEDVTSGSLDAESTLAVELNGKKFGWDTHAKGTVRRGSAKVKVTVPQQAAPIELSTTYGVQRTAGNGAEPATYTADSSVEVRYGDGDKVVKVAGDWKGIAGKLVQSHLRIETPFEQGRVVELAGKSTRSADGTAIDAVASAAVNDQKYQGTVRLVQAENKQSVEVTATRPGGAPAARIAASAQRLGEKKFAAELHLENVGAAGLEARGEVGATGGSWDSFYATADVHAPAARLNRVHVEVTTKAPAQAGGQRTVGVQVTADGKNVVSGNADYTVAQNAAGVTVVTGSGNVKIYEQQKQATFELRRGAEGTASLVFNANVGGVEKVNANVVLKAQNFQVEVSICEDNNKCYKLALKSKLTPPTLEAPTAYAHTLFVHVDLLELGFDKEFILNADTSRQAVGGFKHALEVSLKPKDQQVYVYRVAVGDGRALVELQLPKRTLAVALEYQVPKELPFGEYVIGAATYPDKKNKPNEKASLSLRASIARPDLSGKRPLQSSAVLQFTHPLVRTLTVTASSEFLAKERAGAKLVLDVFRQPDQAMTLEAKYAHEGFADRTYNATYSASIVSKGLEIDIGAEGHSAASLDRQVVTGSFAVSPGSADCRSSVFWTFGRRELEVAARVGDDETVRIEGKASGEGAHLVSTLKSLGAAAKPLKATLGTTGWRSVVAQVTRADTFSADAELTWAKVALVKLTDSAGKELFRAQMALDLAHLCAAELRLAESEVVRKFADDVRARWATEAEQLRGVLTEKAQRRSELVQRQLEKLRSAAPDVEKALEAYRAGVEKLGNELMSDKTVKELVEHFERITGPIRKSIAAILSTLLNFAQTTYAALYQFYTDLAHSVRGKLWPAIQQALQKIAEQAQQVCADTQKLALRLVEKLINTLREFEPEFALFGQRVSEYAKRISELVEKYSQLARKELADLWRVVSDMLQEVPGWEFVKEKYAEFAARFSLPAQWEQVVREALASLRDIMPNEEGKAFIDALTEYINKKLTNKKTDDIADLQAIYAQLITAIKSLYAQLANDYGLNAYASELSTDALLTRYGNTDGRLAPISAGLYHLVRSISQRFLAVHYSGVNHLRDEPLPRIGDAIFNYRPYAFSPLHFLPPFEKHAQLVDGRHAFTFAGAQLSFAAPAACSYVLANDAINGNFTIVARIGAAGALESITLLDKADASAVELLPDGAIKVNGVAADLPALHGELRAWRTFHTVTALSMYGARVECSLDLRVCSVTVNGFYHGQLRGVLGSAGTEPELDGRLPGGKATQHADQLVAAYAIGKCTPTAHSHGERTEAAHSGAVAGPCAEYFKGAGSGLALCFPFVAVQPYRAACEHAVHSAAASGGAAEAACAVARAYTTACRDQHIPVNAPVACVKCPTPAHGVGERFAVTTPAQKQADIVVVVDTSSGHLGDLVAPVLAQLRQELKQRDVSDVHITVLGYEANRKYVRVFAAPGGKLNYGEKTKVAPGEGTDQIAGPLVTGNRRLDSVLSNLWAAGQLVKSDLHQSSDGQAFRMALTYPFRAGAAKAIVAVRNDVLHAGLNPTKELAATFINLFAQHRGIQLHLISPLEGGIAAGSDFKLGNVVGYGAHEVFGLESVPKKNKPVQSGGQAQRDALRIGAATDKDHVGHKEPLGDLGAKMVQSSGGYVYDVGAFESCKPAEQKKWLAVVAASLADKLARTEQQLECGCRIEDGVRAVDECITKDTKWKEPIKRAGTAARG